MRYLHIGIENSSNLGDEAITFCIRQDLTIYNKDFITQSFNFTEGTKNKPHKEKNSLYKFLKRVSIVKFIYDILFVPITNRKSILTFKKNVDKVDIVLIGGGNLLMGLDLVFPIQLLIYVVISKFYKKKVYLIFVGYGPFKSKFSKFIVDLSIKLSDKVIFRDKTSQYLSDSKHEIICDPVLFISNKLISGQNSNMNYNIGIPIMSYLDPQIFTNSSDSKYDNFLSNLANLIDKIPPTRTILLYTTGENSDNLALKRVVNLINNKNVSIMTPGSISELVDITTKCSVVLSTRMHSAIVALSYDIPVIALSWQAKVTELFLDLNLSHYVFPIDEMKIHQHDILGCIGQLLDNEYETYLEVLKTSKAKKGQLYEDFYTNTL